jgi:hypothetical protein
MHTFLRALVLVVTLMATMAAGVTPHVALALPINPGPPGGGDPGGDPGPSDCSPQPVSPDQARLVGYVYLVDPPMVGHPTRIRISQPIIQLPNPGCDDGSLMSVPVPIQTWMVGARPAGSSATVIPRGVEAELVADRSGAWQVVYVACPNGCYLPLARITVPPQSMDISFSAIPVAEGRLSSTRLDSTLKLLLADSRIQISQTGNGTPVDGTPYTVRWSMPAFKYQQLCEPANPPPNWTPPSMCDPDQRVKTLHQVTPSLWSYIDFGPTAEQQAKAPDTVPLPISAVERVVQSDVVRGVFNFAFGGVFDVDRILLLINNVHIELKDGARWQASIANGAASLVLKPDSSHPTVECQGHWRAGIGFGLTLAEGWADEMCPDFDLSTMQLGVKLVPTAQDGLIAVADVQTSADLEPQGVRSELVDFLVGATTIAEERIATTIRTKLLETQNRVALGMLLTRGFKSLYPDLCRVYDARIIGAELVVLYQRTPTSASDMPCTSPLPPQ